MTDRERERVRCENSRSAGVCGGGDGGTGVSPAKLHPMGVL